MINTTIGKYKITKLIGEGGMASVYEAEHEMLGTKVAIKVLNPILSANAEIKTRFRNEAKLMASLDHPNITKVIDFDEQPQQLSIVMEFLKGEDLNDRIKRNGPLAENEISDIFSQTLSAFQYAHEKGIVHRDIKPSNIFILSNGHVKILDFGIAKLFGQGNEMTQTGTQMGTPIYMSPEQVKGDKSIDHRSDIYSLGVTMFFAINGKPPYNSITDSQFDIFNKIVYEPLPVFSIQSKFKEIVSKACQKNKEERFQQCNSWLSEMNNPLTGLSSAPITNDETVIANKVNDDATQVQQPFKKTTTASTQAINENTRVDNTKQEAHHEVNRSNITTANLPQEKKSKTGLIIGIVAGVVLLIITLVATSGSSEENKLSDQDEQQTVTIENKYSVAIPSFLTKASGLNDYASLQYQHAWKEFYVIVIDESKAEMQKALDDNNLTETYTNDIKGYSELLMNGFEKAISVSHKSEIIDTTINNMPARLLTVSGRTEGIDAYYSLAFIQGKERYYQIMAWTLSNKEYEYKDKMNRIMYSLKEL